MGEGSSIQLHNTLGGTMSYYPKPTHSTWYTRIQRLLYPSLGYCFRCGMPWKDDVAYHDTPFVYEDEQCGCFPLCERCWSGLHPKERLPYYDRLVTEWTRQDPSDAVEYDKQRDVIRKAVMEGL